MNVPAWAMGAYHLFWMVLAPAGVFTLWVLQYGIAADWGWGAFLIPMLVTPAWSIAFTIAQRVRENL